MLSDEQLAEIRDGAQSLLSGVGSLPCEQDHGRDILALLDEHAAFKAALEDIYVLVDGKSETRNAASIAAIVARALRGEHA